MARAFALALLLLSLVACGELPIALPPNQAAPSAAPPTAAPEPRPSPSEPAARVTATRVSAVLTPLPAPRCPIIATRTPPAGAPTYVAGGPTTRTSPVDPHLELCANTSTAKVGDKIEVTGIPVDIGLPYYALLVKDETGDEWVRLAEISYENRVRFMSKDSGSYEVAGFNADKQQATFQLVARRPGRYAIRINATGEIHYGYPGPATFSGAGSDPIEISVEP
ncbi:MAG: hypothetical protein ACM3JD_03450 [Rudaea sp.]